MPERSSFDLAGPLLTSGRYQLLTIPVNSVETLTEDQERLSGYLLAPQVISELAVLVRTAGDGTAVVRIGVRRDDAGTPGIPMVEGTVDATSTGWKALSISYSHPGGILWVSIVGQTWTATAVVLDRAERDGLGLVPAATRSTLDWATGHAVYTAAQTGVTGALPAAFTNAQAATLELVTLAAKRA